MPSGTNVANKIIESLENRKDPNAGPQMCPDCCQMMDNYFAHVKGCPPRPRATKPLESRRKRFVLHPSHLYFIGSVFFLIGSLMQLTQR